MKGSGSAKDLKRADADLREPNLAYDSRSLVEGTGDLWRPVTRRWAWSCERGLMVEHDLKSGMYSVIILAWN